MKNRLFAALALLLTAVIIATAAVASPPSTGTKPDLTRVAIDQDLAWSAEHPEASLGLTDISLGVNLLQVHYIEPQDRYDLYYRSWELAREAAIEAGADQLESFEQPYFSRESFGAGSPSEPSFELLKASFIRLFRLSEQNIEQQALIHKTLTGLASSLHEGHTGFLPPRDWTAVRTGRRVEAGISTVIDLRGWRIREVKAGSAAETAGLRLGDLILSINGGPSISEAMRNLEDGVTARFEIERGGQKLSVDVTPVLDTPARYAVTMLPGNVAYIRLYTFNFPSQSDLSNLRREISSLSLSSPSGWILDLRNNGGGSVPLAAEIAGSLGLQGLLLESRARPDSDKPVTTYEGRGQSLIGSAPLAILINRQSYSGSEVLAAALQDTRRATIVGERTGGNVNVANRYEVAGGALQITTARAYAGPSKRYLDKIGVSPDIAVSLDFSALAAGRDSQLEAAVRAVLNPAPVLESVR